MQITANAQTGKTRQINNAKFDTAEIVNAAITVANETYQDNAEAAESYLRRRGHAAPDSALVDQVAYQMAVLAEIEQATSANVSAQLGKWQFSSAQTVLKSFDQYLNRRVQGQRARWNRR